MKTAKTGVSKSGRTRYSVLSSSDSFKEDKVFDPKHLSDFEKLLIAHSYVDQLKKELYEKDVEIGKANAYIAELEGRLNEKEKISHAEKLEFRKSEYFDNFKQQMEAMIRTVKKLRQVNDDLITKLNQ